LRLIDIWRDRIAALHLGVSFVLLHLLAYFVLGHLQLFHDRRRCTM